MTTKPMAGIITPKRKEFQEWVKRKKEKGYLIKTFTTRDRGVKQFWGVVIGRIEMADQKEELELRIEKE